MITTRIKSPADCTSTELDAFETLVLQGGEVTPTGLRQRICSAAHLLFLSDSAGTLVGISALKHPSVAYRAKVFQQAQASASSALFPVELGWIFVVPSHQGQHLSRPLVEHVLPYAAGSLVYATTRADNERMQRTLARYGFLRDGVAYPSELGDYNLVLFVRHAK